MRGNPHYQGFYPFFCIDQCLEGGRRATEVLHRFEAAEREREAVEPTFDPMATLQEIHALSPALAHVLAFTHDVNFALPKLSVHTALAEIDAWRASILKAEAAPVANGGPQEAKLPHAAEA